MENNYEQKLDEFLKNLLKEEYSISPQYYRDAYGKSIEEVTEMYSVIKNKHENFLSTNGVVFGITIGNKPIVRSFLEEGGFVEERKKQEFDELIKITNHDLVVKQLKEIKINRILAIISLIFAFIATIISIYSLNI